jgi:DNA-binding NarL/FixJ family response regulator
MVGVGVVQRLPGGQMSTEIAYGSWELAPRERTRVLVVDDHRTFVDLADLAITNEVDLECVGTATSVPEALAKAHALEPDVVLMDVQLGDGDGIAATAELTATFADLRVVVLSAHVTPTVVQNAADAGASAVLPKDGSLRDLLHAVRTASRGHMLVHPQAFASLRGAAPPQGAFQPPLTPRELEVLQQLGHGASAPTIARDLGISLATCRGHVKSLLTKLGAHSQLEAVVIAMQHRLITVGSADAG